jgi:hypothetical protein
MLGQVNFNLISTDNNAGTPFYFNTDIKGLRVGDIVVVWSRGKRQLGTFLGYSDKEYNAKSKIERKALGSEVRDFWNKVEENLKEKPLTLSNSLFKYYKTHFKGNLNTRKEEAEKKLTRNVILTSITHSKSINNKKLHTFFYGTQMIVVKNNEIVNIKAVNKNSKIKFFKNKEKYKQLNEHFELN